eukprot:CAMPEP_0174333738 /NCGR_PEP_ID=MMETSP0810-20121108/19388_1 /TAXON_ID=73025 ORGANISM="Eutreptiella gymnastica-like, Strain CCMP1594" /NCGR_SAMPLE_ID=MMETSP0810 /ASSEMBLY_ACC=CAM_ASM_000659 /LENGTH=30 /DNA_ID= /DNA_START= /DNA_END= /DNA_ORIENTATION=
MNLNAEILRHESNGAECPKTPSTPGWKYRG